MKRPVRAIVAVATVAAAALAMAGPQVAASTSDTPLWVKHVQRYPGGITNGVRAHIDPAVLSARSTAPKSSGTSSKLFGDQNVQLNDDSRPAMPQDETQVAYDTDEPNIAIAASNDYVALDMAIYRTTDGGKTWSTYRQTPEFFPTRDACTASDPWVAYSSRDEAFYIVTLCFFRTLPYSEVQVWKSADEGVTWTPSRLASVAASNYDSSTGEVDDSIFLDNNQITIDNNPKSPHYGRIYVTYVKFHFQQSGFGDYCPVQLSYTDEIPTDNPQLAVWQHTPVVPDNPGDNGKGATANQWPRPQVDNQGNLDITYALEDCNSGYDRHFMFQKSTDGGASFLPSPVFIDKPGQFKDNPQSGDVLLPTFFRAPNSPGFDVNQATGTLTFAYQNDIDDANSGTNISVQTSTDGGMTWSPMRWLSVTKGGAPAPNDQFFPALDSDQSGRVWAIWFDRRNDPRNRDIETFEGLSVNDGFSFRNYDISTEPWNPNKGFFTSGSFIGDYTGIASNDYANYPIWTDGRNTAYNSTGIGETDIFTDVEIKQ